MLITDYLSRDYPAFEVTDFAEQACAAATDFRHSHAFVMRHGLYIGAISTAFLEGADGKLEMLEPQFEKFALSEGGQMLDAIKLFHTFSTTVVPVISGEGSYLGYISCEDVFAELSKYPLFSENGAVITVSIGLQKYSFSQLSQIIEGNNGKIYGSYISSVGDSDLEITMKISSNSPSSITGALERYGYLVVYKSFEGEKEELLKDRFGFFQKYLEV